VKRGCLLRLIPRILFIVQHPEPASVLDPATLLNIPETMAGPSVASLKSLSRQELQQLCKDNNIRANQKTDELIKSLDEYIRMG
jgi:hypothetical protein